MTATDDICDVLESLSTKEPNGVLARAAAELRQTRKERDEADLSAGVLENAIDVLMKRRDDELYKAHANGRAEFSRELEAKAVRRAIWQSTRGCACPYAVDVDGKPVRLRADERCSVNWVRCNERMARIYDEEEQHGLRHGPVPDGASLFAAAGGKL